MSAKAIIFSILLIIIITFTISTVELFLPLAARADMNMLCRKCLLQMEVNGGMSPAIKDELYQKLAATGFKDIVIQGTENAAYGNEISLTVEAGYTYSRIEALFTRTEVVQRMRYKGTSLSRKVVN
ncbi:MAG TPA: hypothetical protein GXX20_10245 [Clostridiaceae bacterium]|nr:hypothetical protein [Clostridiaceae bacterium]